MELHGPFNKRLQRLRYNWVFSRTSGSDIGWILSQATNEAELAEETGMQFRVAGANDTYQVITFDSASTGLYENLDEAKRVAEKLFLLTRQRPRHKKSQPVFIQDAPSG